MRRSRLHKKAVSVLPDPVGARISVWSPAAIAGQPPDWAAVGVANDASNHAWTGAENSRLATEARYPSPTTFFPERHSGERSEHATGLAPVTRRGAASAASTR